MIRGIYTPNLVPFLDDGRINEEELRRLINWLIEKGVSGLYPNGSTGEFIRLSFEERKRYPDRGRGKPGPGAHPGRGGRVQPDHDSGCLQDLR